MKAVIRNLPSKTRIYEESISTLRTIQILILRVLSPLAPCHLVNRRDSERSKTSLISSIVVSNQSWASLQRRWIRASWNLLKKAIAIRMWRAFLILDIKDLLRSKCQSTKIFWTVISNLSHRISKVLKRKMNEI